MSSHSAHSSRQRSRSRSRSPSNSSTSSCSPSRSHSRSRSSSRTGAHKEKSHKHKKHKSRKHSKHSKKHKKLRDSSRERDRDSSHKSHKKHKHKRREREDERSGGKHSTANDAPPVKKHKSWPPSPDSTDDEQPPSHSHASHNNSRANHNTTQPSDSTETPGITLPAADMHAVDSLMTELIAELHGSAAELEALQFLFFKLQAGELVQIEQIENEQLVSLLWRLFKRLHITERSCEDGSKAFGTTARTPHLLQLLEPRFKAATEAAASALKRVAGPMMPPTGAAATQSAFDAAYDAADDGAVTGPFLPGSRTAAEERALQELRAAREEAAILKRLQEESGAAAAAGNSREQWMSMVPADKPKMTGSQMAELAAAGDKNAMRSRSFANKAVGGGGGDSSVWTDSPAERAQKAREQEATARAMKAIAQAEVRAGGKSSLADGLSLRQTANDSAAAAQAANDAIMAKHKQTQAGYYGESLLQQHQRKLVESGGAGAAASNPLSSGSRAVDTSEGGLMPLLLDREVMGLRALKTDKDVKHEIKDAFSLMSRFQ